jgi:hypothetical protein
MPFDTTAQLTPCCVGYNLFDYMELNPKSEYRNPKQIQMTKNPNPKPRRSGGGRFGHCDFEFLICLEFRI